MPIHLTHCWHFNHYVSSLGYLAYDYSTSGETMIRWSQSSEHYMSCSVKAGSSYSGGGY